MKILGIDYGTKTIGLAVSDATGLIAQALGSIRHKNTDYDLREIKKLADEHGVQQIVVGLPKNMDGSMGPAAEKVLGFADRLQKHVARPVVTWDERLSTAEAERMLIHADVSRAGRKKVIDKVAAAIILQGYLDYCNRGSDSTA